MAWENKNNEEDGSFSAILATNVGTKKPEKENKTMKKALVLLMMIALASTLGTAFAATPGRSAGLYNGITYFDLGPALTGEEFVAPLTQEAAAMPYNGITVFELGKPGTSKRDYVASGSATGGPAHEMKLYNGITVF